MSDRQGLIYYGDEVIRYELMERPLRRTLGIEVHPCGRVLVLVPLGCNEAMVAAKLQLRAGWISHQRTTFSRFERNTVPRQYLSGESYRYLGRQYRLRVSVSNLGACHHQIKLMRGEMLILGQEKLSPAQVKALLRRWYLDRAKEVFAAILTSVFSKFQRLGHKKPRIVVREMPCRWGSLSSNGQMTLNSRLVQAPRFCIEYVISHELCHLIHKDHSPEFFTLLRQVMPDWSVRKHRLEQALL